MKTLERIPGVYVICKLRYLTRVDITLLLSEPFYAFSKSPEETTLLCSNKVVEAFDERIEDKIDNLKAMRFVDNTSKTTNISEISIILSKANINIYTQSTFDTDYILLKETDVEKAESMLVDAGYNINDLQRITQEVA